VRLLRRRSDPPAEERDEPTPPSAAADALDPRRTPGKGRPTPRRREAQRRRTGPVAPPPRTRREAYRRMREQSAERRAEMREGMVRGDERYLMARDRGPERRLVRDIVDSRRNVGVLFLLMALVYAVSIFIPNLQLKAMATSLWLTVLLLLVVDSFVLGLRIRKLVRERFPDTTQSMRALVFYGVSRATMVRRWRQPRPQVPVGNRI
jgi:cation transport ATPase